jgi:Tol biopolymer transport system component
LTGRIAFIRNNQVYAMNANGSGTTSLTHSTATDQTPAWSPDGRKIGIHEVAHRPRQQRGFCHQRDLCDERRRLRA